MLCRSGIDKQSCLLNLFLTQQIGIVTLKIGFLNSAIKVHGDESINSELNRLREIRASLSECIDALPEDDARNKMSMALSFVQMAIGALTILQAKACRWCSQNPTVTSAVSSLPGPRSTE